MMRPARPILGGLHFLRLDFGIRSSSHWATELAKHSCSVTSSARHLITRASFGLWVSNHIDITFIRADELVNAYFGSRNNAIKITEPFSQKSLVDIASSYNLSVCPPDVGPNLAREFSNQPRFSSILIMMKPIETKDRELQIFRVGHDSSGINLDTRLYSSPENPRINKNHFLCFRRVS